jgi:hypothetical protein
VKARGNMKKRGNRRGVRAAIRGLNLTPKGVEFLNVHLTESAIKRLAIDDDYDIGVRNHHVPETDLNLDRGDNEL